MRTLLLAVLLLAPSLAAQQRIVRGLHADPDVALRLWVPAGNVEVEGWDRDSIEVRATPSRGTNIVGGGSASGAKYALESATPSDTSLASAQLRVFVPRRARLWIKSTLAVVQVRGVRGELDVLQVGGDTFVTDAGGTITVESIDGRITLGGIDGVTRIRGGGGQVTLAGISGSLDATLVSAGMSIQAAKGVPAPLLIARVETVGGMISWQGNLASGSRLELSTHDGDIQVVLGTETRVRLDDPPAGATIPPRVLSKDPKAPRVVLRTFKGKINVGVMSGI